MPKNRKFLIAALVVFLALAYLGYRGFSGSASYYFTVSEVVEKGDSVYGQSLRVNGDVVEGSVDWKPERLTLSFVMADAGGSLPVTYKGIAPDTFQAGSEVVVAGKINADGVLRATEILTKCPSKYEPEE
ncbi:MAG: cytochrome c maturation protein CcmE [Dehalococcoidia bacterium]